ncbi:manganese-binding transcriptional regulator MntR [Aliiruegeria sabulilitoris]|uniref:manganese-binding transcriptional regulator MntR n=1 Tax=Aliiruegeria sabulilitoris TaxID=1510458 RepID=UPI00083277A1|nr:manganese-binding transcriptional regulator MntR [Aliiruegeria sabulilitoris]NDR58954.1 manganese-binding transcriptional regulator MntR [Pseudoruegeria sp. M32A2M]
MQQDRPEESEAIVEPERFNQARAAQSMAILEDYVEMIGDLIGEFGEARITDIAQRMGVTHPTATKAVSRLKREGLAISRPYRGVFLTDEGAAMAELVRARHRTVVDLLVAIGVPAETAELDAEGMEHHVSDVTLKAFEAFLERATSVSDTIEEAPRKG